MQNNNLPRQETKQINVVRVEKQIPKRNELIVKS
jgi:hypothetical protein